MDSLGFGMVDKRTVAAVLFALALAAILGLRMPVDFSDVGHIFVSVVLLTGYLYFARTVSRAPLVIYVFIRRKRPIKELVIAWFVYEYGDGMDAARRGFTDLPLYIINVIDRLIVIASVLIACIPTVYRFVTIFGAAGIIVMLTVYVLLGSFSLLLRDAIDSAKYSKY